MHSDSLHPAASDEPAAAPPGSPELVGEPAGQETAEPGAAPTPAAEPAQLERLDRRVVPYWLCSGSVGFVLLAGVAAAATWLLLDHYGELRSWLTPLAIALIGILLLWTLVAPALDYARWRFGITDEILLMRHGILWHQEKAIPISRLQHVDLTRGPIERLFGLATLVVFTAGSEAAAFRVPGLDVVRAGELRDRILAARGEDVI